MQRFSIGYRRAITLSLVLITGICTELSAQFTGSALRLDSTAAGAKVTDPSPLRSIDGDFSVELWIAPEEGGTVLTGRGSTPLAASWSISIGTKGKVTLDLQGRCSGTTSPPLSPQKASVGFGRWNHLALTYSASDSTLTLLLNGAVVLTDQTSCRSIRLGDGSGSDEISIEIGGSDGHAGMKGAIDEVRIWKSLRTVAEIRAGLSISQLADPDLATSWPLDDASRTTLHDGATLVDATLPNYQLPGTPSDIDLLWNQRQATDTSAITISSADLDDGSYLLIGNNGQAMTTTPSAIEGVKRQLRRVWRLNGIDVDWYDVSGAIPDDIAAENLALLVASDSNFIEHARLLYPDIDSASGSFSGHVQITADDSLAYLTLVEIGDEE